MLTTELRSWVDATTELPRPLNGRMDVTLQGECTIDRKPTQHWDEWWLKEPSNIRQNDLIRGENQSQGQWVTDRISWYGFIPITSKPVSISKLSISVLPIKFVSLRNPSTSNYANINSCKFWNVAEYVNLGLITPSFRIKWVVYIAWIV